MEILIAVSIIALLMVLAMAIAISREIYHIKKDIDMNIKRNNRIINNIHNIHNIKQGDNKWK
jgi:type II secretory pathway component PulJ